MNAGFRLVFIAAAVPLARPTLIRLGKVAAIGGKSAQSNAGESTVKVGVPVLLVLLHGLTYWRDLQQRAALNSVRSTLP